MMPIPPATCSANPYLEIPLTAPKINRQTGDKIHRKVANAIDFDVAAFAERKAFASSIETRLSVETSSDGIIRSASSISSFSK